MSKISFEYLNTKYQNRFMKKGKKRLSLKIFYQILKELLKKKYFFTFRTTFLKATALAFTTLRIREQRLGKQQYLVPTFVKRNRRLFMVISRFYDNSKDINKSIFIKNYTKELLSMSKLKGQSFKQVIILQNELVSNRHYSHYRW